MSEANDSEMSPYIQVTTAVDSAEAAQQIADLVITQRLAACCWVSGPVTSTYWWQGKVGQAQEWVCTIKTRRERYERLEQVIKANHPYDVPEILAVPILTGNAAYLAWMAAETNA